MPLHDDEQFLAAVAAALGETISLVRRRGCHLDGPSSNSDPRPTQSEAARHVDIDDDSLDFAECGIDWDAHVDGRVYHRPRRRAVRGLRPKAA